MKLTAALGALALFATGATAAFAADLPDLAGREIVVVTENAYPPLQFVDANGAAVGWEYDAMAEIAQRLNKSTRVLPAWLLQSALWLGSRLGLSRYGPEQLDFLRYRPVLLNTAHKTQFGYTPTKTSAQALEAYMGR